MDSRAFVHILVGILKPSSARVVELSHCLGTHLKIGNCSVGRYVPGLKAAFICSLCYAAALGYQRGLVIPPQ